jgi:tetratricopeptide (TPR) repeat protein
MRKSLCLAAVLVLSVTTVSCTKVQARMEIKEANTHYASERYAEALARYEAARQIDGSFPELDRMIGYSFIGLYRPEDDSPENQQHADRAIQELQRYLKRNPADETARDALINLFLNAERTTQAIDFFRDHLRTNPDDLASTKSIATLYSKQGDFNEALIWYERVARIDSSNPESFYIFGVVCYEKVAKNPPADMAERLAIIEQGKQALGRAIELRDDYFDANVYMNLLYREQAKVEEDPDKQQELMAKADEYRLRAIAINEAKKQQQT